MGQGDWENVLCVTIKGRAVLFTTSFDYIWEWKELGVSEDLEWPSVCYIQGGMHSKGVTGGWSWVKNLLGESNCNTAWNSMSSVVGSYLANWWSGWASSSLGSIQGVRRMESSNYSGDKWWPTHWVIQQIIIDSLIGKRDLERSREVRNVAVETKKHRA